jgi:hypothetical protein
MYTLTLLLLILVKLSSRFILIYHVRLVHLIALEVFFSRLSHSFYAYISDFIHFSFNLSLYSS